MPAAVSLGSQFGHASTVADLFVVEEHTLGGKRREAAMNLAPNISFGPSDLHREGFEGKLRENVQGLASRQGSRTRLRFRFAQW